MKQWTDFGTLIVATLALGLSTCSFIQENDRAQRLLEREDTQTKNEVLPFLVIQKQDYDEGYGIRLRNVGLGPAVIESAVFTKDGRQTDALVELFPEIDGDAWIDYIDLPGQGASVLAANKHWDLTRLGDVRFKKQYKSLENGITYEIHYRDILGNLAESPLIGTL